ncbi:tripartite motif-containing protein 16-like [Gastrophryne carolinensis]
MTTARISCTSCGKGSAERIVLPCGQKLCQDCAELVANTQEPCGLYCCDPCLHFYEEQQINQEHPEIKREVIESSQPGPITCTYCDVPAVKTCVKCESSFCTKCLMKHPQSPEHILMEPVGSMDEINPSKSSENLSYDCTGDLACVCRACHMDEDDQNLNVESLNDYVEKKKNNMRRFMEKLKAQKDEIEKQLHNQRKRAEKENARREKVVNWIEDIRKNLDDLEEETLSVALSSASDQIVQLEKQRKDISDRIDDVTELCAITDPLTYLKNELRSNIKEINAKDYSHIQRGDQISMVFRSKFLTFADGLTSRVLQDLPKMKKSKIRLDVDTAHNKIFITTQGKTASHCRRNQARKSHPLRFRSCQVLSKNCFTSGNHYWVVKVKGKQCSIGVACSTIERRIRRSTARIGCNKRSWALHIDDVLRVSHSNIKIEIKREFEVSPVLCFGVLLEYDEGRLSFYKLENPITHLHTFTATFTTPLHAAFYLAEGSKIMM